MRFDSNTQYTRLSKILVMSNESENYGMTTTFIRYEQTGKNFSFLTKLSNYNSCTATANRNHHQPHRLSTTQNAVHDYHLSLEMQLNKES